jgi:hypothetical protein
MVGDQDRVTTKAFETPVAKVRLRLKDRSSFGLKARVSTIEASDPVHQQESNEDDAAPPTGARLHLACLAALSRRGASIKLSGEIVCPIIARIRS